MATVDELTLTEPRRWWAGIVPGRRLIGRLGRPPELVALVLLLVAWEVLPRIFATRWLPAFSEVSRALWELYRDGLLVDNLLASLRSLGIGFGLSLGGGLIVGGLMGRFRLVEAALDTYVSAALFTPSLILAPIFFAIFGLGDATRIAVVVAYALPIVILNTATGVRTVDPAIIEMGKAFGCSEWVLFRRVLLPGSLPLVLEGTRLGLGRAIKGMINGEVFIALTGLGGLASTYGSQLASDKVLAVSLVVLILAVAANWAFTRIETRLTSWVG